MFKPSCLALCVLLHACTAFPELPDTYSEHQDTGMFPNLRPIDPIPQDSRSESTEAALKAQAAALQADADRLRNQSQ
jgi:hypothetical protein